MSTPTSESQENDSAIPFPAVEDEPPKPSEKKKSPNSHKRSISGSLLSRLNIIRTNDGQVFESESPGESTSPSSPSRGSTSEVQSKSSRKRKGSLRKAVLGKGRDRRGSEKKSPLSSPKTTPATTNLPKSTAAITPPALLEGTEDDIDTPRPSRDLSNKPAQADTAVAPEVPPRWPFRTLSRVSVPSIRSSIASIEPGSSAASILISPTLATDSTDDDVDLQLPNLPSNRQQNVNTITNNNPLKKPPPNSDSYFPAQLLHPTTQSQSHLRQPSPLSGPSSTSLSSSASLPSPSLTTPTDEWDYSSTAFWGYIILFTTWIVFVVGMGSCFGVWSWAWDVGETPYAPPELEDDPTLPIVGYYPALMVLTGIMAWVWVVVAWVGMKYFRHARGMEGG